jgi:lysophospholipase L1-like esterase
MLSVNSFLAFGDSITWGEDGTESPSSQGRHVEVQLTGQTYPDDLERDLQARDVEQLPTVTNCGYKGETLATQLEDQSWTQNSTTINRFLAAIGTGQYGAVLIMEGSNDVNNAAGDSKVLAPAASVLQTMIESAKAAGVHPFLATVPPMVPPGYNGRPKGYQVVPTYNAMLTALAGSEAVPLVDIYGAFGSNAPSLIGFDGLHPNAAGYQLIADTFFAAIQTVLETQQSIGRILSVRRPAATGGECPGLPS